MRDFYWPNALCCFHTHFHLSGCTTWNYFVFFCLAGIQVIEMLCYISDDPEEIDSFVGQQGQQGSQNAPAACTFFTASQPEGIDTFQPHSASLAQAPSISSSGNADQSPSYRDASFELHQPARQSPVAFGCVDHANLQRVNLPSYDVLQQSTRPVTSDGTSSYPPPTDAPNFQVPMHQSVTASVGPDAASSVPPKGE